MIVGACIKGCFFAPVGQSAFFFFLHLSPSARCASSATNRRGRGRPQTRGRPPRLLPPPTGRRSCVGQPACLTGAAPPAYDQRNIAAAVGAAVNRLVAPFLPRTAAELLLLAAFLLLSGAAASPPSAAPAHPPQQRGVAGFGGVATLLGGVTVRVTQQAALRWRPCPRFLLSPTVLIPLRSHRLTCCPVCCPCGARYSKLARPTLIPGLLRAGRLYKAAKTKKSKE